jgi:hypothetical protein
LIADGNSSFPIVMVGGVLEANKSWDIGKEVINCIHEHYPGAYPIRPTVRIPLFPPFGKHWSRFHFLFFIIKQTLCLSLSLSLSFGNSQYSFILISVLLIFNQIKYIKVTAFNYVISTYISSLVR